MQVKSCSNIDTADCDVVIFINDDIKDLGEPLHSIEKTLRHAEDLEKNVPLLINKRMRLIYIPIGSLDWDGVDSSVFYFAATRGVKIALENGCKKPLLVLGNLSTAPKGEWWTKNDFPLINAALGTLNKLYSLRKKETKNGLCHPLLVYGATEKVIETVNTMLEVYHVTRSILGYTFKEVLEYIETKLNGTPEINVNSSWITQGRCPLLSFASRKDTEKNETEEGYVVRLMYDDGNSTADTTLYFTGVGVYYDSEISNKTSSVASIIGLFKALSVLKPKGLRVVAFLGIYRKTLWKTNYFRKDVIKTLAGRKVQAGFMDTTGQMASADLLYEAKMSALRDKNPFIFSLITIASSTCIYLLDNGPANKRQVAEELQYAGNNAYDNVEILSPRSTDYVMVRGEDENADLLRKFPFYQSDDTQISRCYAGFMRLASGLDKHGIHSKEKQLPFTCVTFNGNGNGYGNGHCNGNGYGNGCGNGHCNGNERTDLIPPGIPTLMFVSRYILPRL